MTIKELQKKATKEFYWYVHNISTSRPEALEYANKTYDHALYAGYITEKQHKKLCLELPFLTYLK